MRDKFHDNAGGQMSVDRRQAGGEYEAPQQKTIKILGRDFRMPESRALRITIGVLLVIFGVLGFLPILGFWMIPLGLIVLSYEFATVRRMRRRGTVWWERRRRSNGK